MLIQHTDVHHHTMVLGSTNRGKSAIMQAEAARLGISYDALLQRLEPMAVQREQQRIQQASEERIENTRLDAVREAYWSHTPDVLRDLGSLYDALVDAGVNDPTPEQIKTVFMMLPADILGLAISWGFSDTEVGDQICQFVSVNKKSILDGIVPA